MAYDDIKDGNENKADVAIQKQAVLRKSDLSAGWKSSPDPASTPLPALPACAGLQEVNDALEPIATDLLDAARKARRSITCGSR